MNKNILAIVITLLLVVGAVFYIGFIENNGELDLNGNDDMSNLIDCLAENDLVIYGTSWCPACTQLVDSFGGYDAIDPIYVECAEGTEEEAERCAEETKTEYVPEIQIAGELYEGPNDPRSLAQEVGCEL